MTGDRVSNGTKRDMSLATICVVGMIVTFRFTDYLGPTEFSGGTVTGPMFSLHSLAGDLFPLAIVVAFFYPPVAAGIGLLACVMALPIFLLFLFPRPFQHLFPGEWSAPATSNFTLDPWSVVGVATIAAVVFVSIRIFRSSR